MLFVKDKTEDVNLFIIFNLYTICVLCMYIISYSPRVIGRILDRIETVYDIFLKLNCALD